MNYEGGWHRDIALRGTAYYPPGPLEEASEAQPTIFIPDKAMAQLVDWLYVEGHLHLAKVRDQNPTAVTPAQREPDLTIIARLTDLLEKTIS